MFAPCRVTPFIRLSASLPHCFANSGADTRFAPTKKSRPDTQERLKSLTADHSATGASCKSTNRSYNRSKLLSVPHGLAKQFFIVQEMREPKR